VAYKFRNKKLLHCTLFFTEDKNFTTMYFNTGSMDILNKNTNFKLYVTME